MVRLAIRPRPGAVVGGPAFLAKLAHAVAPPITGQMAAAMLELYLRQAGSAPVPDGNLFAPVALGDTSHGGWGKQNWSLVGAALTASGVGALWATIRHNKTGATASSE